MKVFSIGVEAISETQMGRSAPEKNEQKFPVFLVQYHHVSMMRKNFMY